MQIASQETINARGNSGFVPRLISNPMWSPRPACQPKWHDDLPDPIDLAKQHGLIDRLQAILNN